MSKNIFFVGPASVGKSTIGQLLSLEIGYGFIDVDKEFCERIALIPDVVRNEGYAAYCEKNSNLVDVLLGENPENTVFATPSGFLVHEDSLHLVEKHLNVIKSGISVLLLPDKDPLKGVETIVQRQLSRWDDINAATEKERFLRRFEKYKQYGDIQIFSMDKPEVIVKHILKLSLF